MRIAWTDGLGVGCVYASRGDMRKTSSSERDEGWKMRDEECLIDANDIWVVFYSAISNPGISEEGKKEAQRKLDEMS